MSTFNASSSGMFTIIFCQLLRLARHWAMCHFSSGQYGPVWGRTGFGSACGWVLPAGLVRAEDFASFFLVLLDLRRFLGPPPALAGSGRTKLSSRLPPTVRFCGDT